MPRAAMNDTVAQLSPPFLKGGSGGILLDRGSLKSPLASLCKGRDQTHFAFCNSVMNHPATSQRRLKPAEW